MTFLLGVKIRRSVTRIGDDTVRVSRADDPLFKCITRAHIFHLHPHPHHGVNMHLYGRFEWEWLDVCLLCRWNEWQPLCVSKVRKKVGESEKGNNSFSRSLQPYPNFCKIFLPRISYQNWQVFTQGIHIMEIILASEHPKTEFQYASLLWWRIKISMRVWECHENDFVKQKLVPSRQTSLSTIKPNRTNVR